MELEFSVGKCISSRTASYKVQKYLGRGAFGTVTECKKETTNETVALKISISKEQIRVARSEVQYNFCLSIVWLCLTTQQHISVTWNL